MDFSAKLDKVGSVVSFVCAIHCFLTPLLIVIFPVALAEVLGHHVAHDWLVIASISLAIISLIIGHQKHKNYNIFILPVISAFLFMLSAHKHNDWSNSLILATAGLILVATHLLNRKLCEQCKDCKRC